MRLASLFIAATETKGRGVFTYERIPADTIIEIAPVIVMSGDDKKFLDQTLLHDYIFEWGPEQKECAMALGWIPVYNHAYESNSEYFMDFDDATMFIKTVRLIHAGEEISINYNGNWNDEQQVWFDVKD